MKRTPLPKRTRPLARPTKPLKRTAITKKPTKRKLAIIDHMNAAKDGYFSKYLGLVGNANFYPCQRCRQPMDRDTCHAHHKIKRSLGGGHGLANLVILCPRCHGWAHAESHPENLQTIRNSPANADNARWIYD